MNKNRKRYSKKTGLRAMAFSMAAAMAVTLYPIPAFAAESGQTAEQTQVQVQDKTGEISMIMENPEMIRQHQTWMSPQS